MFRLFFNTVSLFLLVSCGYALSSTPPDQTEWFGIGVDQDGDLIVLPRLGSGVTRLDNKVKKNPSLMDDVLFGGSLRDVKNLFKKAEEARYQINLVDFFEGNGEVAHSLLNMAEASSIDPVAKINYLMPMYTDDMLRQVLREPQFLGGRLIADDIFFRLVDQLEKGVYDKEFVDNVLRTVRLSPNGLVHIASQGRSAWTWVNKALPRLLFGLEKMSKDSRYRDLLKEVLKKTNRRPSEDYILNGRSLRELLIEKYPGIQLPSLDEAASSSSANDAASSNMARHRVASAVAQRGIRGLLEDDADESVRGIERF